MDMPLLLSVGSFIIILALLVAMRASDSRFEVKPSDIVVAVVPVVLFLLVTGKLQKFEIGEGGVKIETAFVNASASAIASQVTPMSALPSEPIATDLKRGVEEIPKFIEQKTEGLEFRMGHGGYYGPAIAEYLTRLTQEPYLNHLIIEERDGSFFGIADARKLAALFQTPRTPVTAADLARWLNKADGKALAQLPGFVPAADALTEATDKGAALEKMETLDRDTLPVIDGTGKFVGIVERSRLTASLLIDVAKNLQQ